MKKLLRLIRPTIITVHLIRSFIMPFLIAEIFFSFVVLLFNMRQVIQAVLEKGVDFSMLLQLLIYSMGWTIGMTVPMSALLGIIMTIGTLNADQEIIALRASGIPYFRIFRPYLVFGCFIAAFLLWYQMIIVPYCMRMVNIMAENIAAYNPTALIEAGQFTALDNQKRTSRQIYVESTKKDEKSGRLIFKGVQIRKTQGSELTELVYADHGEKIKKWIGPKNMEITALRLYDGFVYIKNIKDDGFEKLNFINDGYLDINLKENFSRMGINKEPTIIEMSVTQLKEALSRYQKAGKKTDVIHIKTEYSKRTALPFATLLLILAGFPLGIVNHRSGRGVGFGQAIIIIFIYFSFYFASDAIASHSGIFSPFIAAWLGNFVILLFGVLLFLLKTTDLIWKIKWPGILRRRAGI